MATRAPKEDEKDRLSNLPDSLIHRILSFLDTKTVVQTCVLSKRWNHLWTRVPTLNFDSQSFKRLISFKKFVFHVLPRHQPCNLHGLKLHSRSLDKAFIDAVLHYAASHSVKKMHLYHHDLHPIHPFELFDDDLSRFDELEKLIIDRCYISSSRVLKISAPRLVVLNLSRVIVKNIALPYKLVVSCPRLSSFYYWGICPSALSLIGCPILDRINMYLYFNTFDQEKQERLACLKNLFQGVILHAKLVVLRMRGWKVEIILRKEGGVRAIFYNETTTEEKILFWRADDPENFELFLDLLLQRCEYEMPVAGIKK